MGHDVAAVEADLDLGLSAVNASGVVAYNSWLAGYQTSFDIGKSVITKNNFGIGYTAPDFVLHTSVNNGTDFGGSVYQKVNSNLEAGISLVVDLGPDAAVGVKDVLGAQGKVC